MLHNIHCPIYLQHPTHVLSTCSKEWCLDSDIQVRNKLTVCFQSFPDWLALSVLSLKWDEITLVFFACSYQGGKPNRFGSILWFLRWGHGVDGPSQSSLATISKELLKKPAQCTQHFHFLVHLKKLSILSFLHVHVMVKIQHFYSSCLYKDHHLLLPCEWMCTQVSPFVSVLRDGTY